MELVVICARVLTAWVSLFNLLHTEVILCLFYRKNIKHIYRFSMCCNKTKFCYTDYVPFLFCLLIIFSVCRLILCTHCPNREILGPSFTKMTLCVNRELWVSLLTVDEMESFHPFSKHLTVSNLIHKQYVSEITDMRLPISKPSWEDLKGHVQEMQLARILGW